MDQQARKLKLVIIGMAVCLLAAVAVILVLVLKKPQTPTAPSEQAGVSFAEDYTGNRPTYKGGKIENTDTIACPGYKALGMKADTVPQQVNFYNPEENNCYFKISLKLEDGTLLWESELLEPGKAFYDIDLLKTLPEGEYPNTTLKYECFAMNEERTALNGSEIRLTLFMLK